MTMIEWRKKETNDNKENTTRINEQPNKKMDSILSPKYDLSQSVRRMCNRVCWFEPAFRGPH